MEAANGGGEVPWYQQTSQDVWQTTPAYVPEGGAGGWGSEQSKEHGKRGPQLHNTTQQVLVKEVMVPVLQVCINTH